VLLTMHAISLIEYSHGTATKHHTDAPDMHLQLHPFVYEGGDARCCISRLNGPRLRLHTHSEKSIGGAEIGFKPTIHKAAAVCCSRGTPALSAAGGLAGWHLCKTSARVVAAERALHAGARAILKASFLSQVQYTLHNRGLQRRRRRCCLKFPCLLADR
jgi:hypothetical protein